MTEEQLWMLKVLCLLAGYAFGGFLTAEVVARCMAGVGVSKIGTGRPSAANIARCLGRPAGVAVTVGDVLKTILACWFCYKLAAPELEHVSILYGGLGAVLGHIWPLWYRGRGGKGAAVVCTWIILYLPITGGLCCLAGLVVVAGTGRRSLGAVLVPALAIPVAWVQFGIQSGMAMLTVTLLLLWKCQTDPEEGKKEKPTISPKWPF